MQQPISSPAVGRLRQWQLPIIVALYIGLVLNYPFYRELASVFAGLDRVDPGFVLSIPLFICSVLSLLLTLLCWGPLTKPLLATLILLSSVVSYGGLTYGVVVDYGMVENIAETNSTEALSYVTPQALLWFVVTAVVPIGLLFGVRLHPGQGAVKACLRSGAVVLGSLACVLTIALLYYQDYASVGRNNSYLKTMIVPTHAIYSGAKYLSRNYLAPPRPFQVVGEDARQQPRGTQARPSLLVLVVGETARAQNLHHYGYDRDTTPFTRAQGVIAFKDVASCGTATAVSVPCMFSHFNRDNFDGGQARNQSNLMDLLNRAGVDTLWLDNDGGSKGVADRIRHIDIDPGQHPGLCDGKVCLDEVMVEQLRQQMEGLQGNAVVALHLIGSHGPTYFKRYPAGKGPFLPACEQASIENCSTEELVNVYDNTLYYTDYVLGQLIATLKQASPRYNTALLYLSDHGESLGENGLYLHGFPYALAPEQQTRVPMLLWASPQFASAKSLDLQCVTNEAGGGGFSHDNLFDSVLGIMDVATSLYRQDQDLFAGCRAVELAASPRGPAP